MYSTEEPPIPAVKGDRPIQPAEEMTNVLKEYLTPLKGEYDTLNKLWGRLENTAEQYELSLSLQERVSVELEPVPDRATTIILLVDKEEEDENAMTPNRRDNLFCRIIANRQTGVFTDFLLRGWAIMHHMQGRSDFVRYLKVNLY